MNKHINVLIVEDSEDDVLLLLRELKKGGYKTTHLRVETATAMKKALKEQNWDIILSDYKMPKFSGPAALKVLQASKLDIPFIIVSGSVGEDAAVELLKEGAYDFITKLNLSRLIPAIERELKDWKIRQENKLAAIALKESEHRYRHLFEHHPNPMWVYDLATLKFIDVNEAAIDKYGYSREEFLSMTLFDIRPKQDYARLKADLAKPRPPLQHSGEWRHLLKNGEIIYVDINSYLFEHNNKKLALVVVTDITERKRAEELLRKSELQFQTLAHMSPAGIFRTDANGLTIYVNPRWCQISGLSAAEAMRDGWLKAVHPDDKEKIKINWETTIRTHQISSAEYRFVRPDGTTSWVMGQAVPEKNFQNQVVGYVGTIIDITERKRAEKALIESEEKFRNLVENINDVFYVSDDKGILLYCSPNISTSTGFSLEEIIGKSYLRLVAPIDRRKVVDHYLNETKKGVLDTKLEFRVRCKDGKIIWVEQNTRIVRDSNGNLLQYRNVAREITERKRAEEALKESEERYRLIAENTGDVISVFDMNMNYTFVSPSVKNLLGYSDKEMLSLKLENILPPNSLQLVYESLKEEMEIEKSGIADPNRTRTLETDIYRKDGSLISIQSVISFIRNNEGKIVNILAISRDITARKQAELALQESERRLSTLMGNIPGMAYRCLYDRNWTMKYVSQGCIDLTGYHPEQLIENKEVSFNDLIDENFREQLWDKWQKVLKNKEVFQDEYTIKTADGKQKWVWEQGCGIYNDRGEVIALEGLIIDITERKRAEETMLKLSKAVESSGEVIFMTNPDGIFTYINPEFTKLYGYQPEVVIGKSTPRILKSGVMKQEEYEVFWQMLLNKQVVEMELINKTKKGELITVEVSINPILDENNNTIGYLAIQRDVTERKKAEEALKLQTTYFTQLFENSPTGIAFLDTNACVMNVNKAFEKIFQFSLEEIKGKSLTNLIVPEEFVKEATLFSSRAISGEIVRLSSIRKRRDGTLVDLIITGYPIIIEGRCVGIYTIFTDVSDIKKLEEQIRQAQKLESIGTLAGGIAHDFNNILGIILGYTSLLESAAGNPAKIKQSAEAITKAVHRGAGLVKQILTFARKTNIIIEPVNVNDSIHELVKMLNETFPKTIELSINLDGKLPNIIADHNQIHQAILNLSLNARDAILSKHTTTDTGKITFTTKLVSGTELRSNIPDALDDQYVCISVSDNGNGMDNDTIKRIFEPFFTTKEQGKGTGLGLAVVYGVVKSHRGYIDVQSGIGVGTTFNLYFPLQIQEESQEKIEEEPQVPIPGGTETILFVEDEEMLQDVVKTQLTLKGYRVLSAFDGLEAVEMYRKNQNDIAVVLSDLGLPKLGGFEAFLRMKEINPNAKIILASGFFDPSQKSSMMEAGIEHFVQKPYKVNEILRVIRELLDN